MSSPTHKSHFKELKDWSERKHRLLENYLGTAVKIMTKMNQVYYIDGFAGSGTYGDTEEAKGSPIRAAELAQQYLEEQKPYVFKCINIEENLENFRNLQNTTARFGDLVLNLSGTFVGNINRIKQEVSDKPVICFLDPFGVEGIDRAAIKSLINRRSATDLWIRFDTSTVRRIDGFFDSSAASADKLYGILSRVYGIDDRSKLHKLLEGDNAEKRIQNALNLYMKCLANDFTSSRGEGYTAAYKIRSLQGENKYYLVFGTANKKGITLASDVVYSAETNYQIEVKEYNEQKELQRPKQLSFAEIFEPTQQDISNDKVQRLKEDIWELCKRKNISRMDIHVKLLSNWFGEFKGTHLTKALQGLIEDGQIVSKSGVPSNEKSTFQFR